MSKSKKIGLGIVGTLLVLLIIVFVYYFISLTKPKKVFENITSEITSKTNNFLKEFNFLNNKEEYSVDANVKYSDTDNSVLSKYSYSAQIDLDKTNKKLLASLKALRNNKEVIGANVQADDKQAYLSIPQVYDKNIVVGEMEEYWKLLTTNNQISNDDCIYLINFIQKAFVNSLKDTDFQISKVNNKRQITLTLDGNRQKEIFNNIVGELDKDTKTKKIVATLFGITETEAMNNLKEAANDINDSNIKIVFTTENFSNKITNLVFKVDNIELLNITLDNDNYTINVSALLKITVTKNKNNYDIKIFAQNQEVGSITYKQENNKWQIEFKIESIQGNISYEQVKKDNIKFGMSLTVDNKSYNIETDITTKDKVNIPEINLSNTISSDDIPEAELEEISNKLMENEFIKDISQIFSNLHSDYKENSYSDYELDFDSDYDYDFDFDYNIDEEL